MTPPFLDATNIDRVLEASARRRIFTFCSSLFEVLLSCTRLEGAVVLFFHTVISFLKVYIAQQIFLMVVEVSTTF